MCMMTSSNGNIFHVTGHLCGEFTGPRWIPRTKASDAELWCLFYLRLNKRLSKRSWGWWFETQSRPLWHHCNGSDYKNPLHLDVVDQYLRRMSRRYRYIPESRCYWLSLCLVHRYLSRSFLLTFFWLVCCCSLWLYISITELVKYLGHCKLM